MSRDGLPGGCNPADVLYKLAHSRGIKAPIFEMVTRGLINKFRCLFLLIIYVDLFCMFVFCFCFTLFFQWINQCWALTSYLFRFYRFQKGYWWRVKLIIFVPRYRNRALLTLGLLHGAVHFMRSVMLFKHFIRSVS